MLVNEDLNYMPGLYEQFPTAIQSTSSVESSTVEAFPLPLVCLSSAKEWEITPSLEEIVLSSSNSTDMELPIAFVCC